MPQLTENLVVSRRLTFLVALPNYSHFKFSTQNFSFLPIHFIRFIMCDANKNACDKKPDCDKKPACPEACPPPAPVCQPSPPNPKDCEECQATLKAHLKSCCAYGIRPKLIEKCSDIEGGCSTPKPACCPVPPPKPCPCPPVIKCDTPPTATFTCPESCAKPEKPACDAKPACEAKPACGPAAAAPAKENCGSGSKATNDCVARPLSMARDDGTAGCTRPNC